ncbi:T9SS type A sorting domain-containing protein [Hymenobacter nivis]|uniref:T9SS C-terminal target domain-containing protein n=1 Tax=Hymenobacter nivis TaxID=1850093 RepID=A0A2Z3GDW7_9BACT|nr:T9SS type A sorting domain-containing protein [Hymenobacter nivis]AWM31809.1 hypothetical protein DDQ68_02820 [Hymenobacter nivis]
MRAGGGGQQGHRLNSERFQGPVQVGTDANWRSASASANHSVAVRTDGTLWTWGSNSGGQLGTGTTTAQTTPVQVGTAATWLRVAAGAADGRTVAIRTDGTFWAWGNNYYGQLGDGTTAAQLVPLQIGSGTNWLSTSAGSSFTAAIQADGSLWEWGYNDQGQLGQDNANLLPIYIPFGGTALATAAASAAAGWQLAPNPAHGQVQLPGLPAGTAVRFFDAQGRLVRTAAGPAVALDGLTPGLYLLQAAAGGTTRTQRLVVE